MKTNPSSPILRKDPLRPYPEDQNVDAKPKLQSAGWAVFAPSGAVSWRSFETSLEASLRAFAGPNWTEDWPAHEAIGCQCLPIRFAPDLVREG